MPKLDLQVQQEATRHWEDMKMHSKYQALVMRVSDDCNQIELEKAIDSCDDSMQEQLFAKLYAELPRDECRFVFFKVNWKHVETGQAVAKRTHIVFISTTPNQASVKNKLTSAACRGSLRFHLHGTSCEIQMSLENESFSDILTKVTKGSQ